MSGGFDAFSPPLIDPLPGELPAGQEPKYAEPHEAARAEVAKLTSPSGGAVDWARVEKAAGEVLSSHGKDLLMAAYWTAAAYRQRGLPGVLEGLALVGSLCERFGEGLYPGRPRARIGAVEWLVEHLATRLGEHAVSTPEADAVEALSRLLPQLDSALAGLLGDEAPSFRPVSDALERLRMSLPSTPGEAAPSAAAASSVTSGEAEQGASEASGEPAASMQTEAAGGGVGEPDEGAPEGRADAVGEAARSRAARWLEPVSEAEPAGSDARYHERHEALRAEVAKLDNPSGGPPDWKRVLDHADVLLREVSKDLVVATHLCQALWQEGTWEAVATSMWLLEGLCARYAQGLHPLRARARANALSLVTDKLEQCVGELDAETLVLSQAKALVAASEAMFAQLREFAPDDAPSERGVGAALRRLELTVEERAEAEKTSAPAGPGVGASPDAEGAASSMPGAAAQSAPGPNRAPAAHVPEAAAAPADPAQLMRFLRSTGASLGKVADMLVQANPHDPAAFRLRRLGSWLTLMRVTNEQIAASSPPAPNEQMRARMEQLYQQGAWETLAKEAEAALALAPSWLDLQLFCARALEQLGAQAAAEAVSVEARALAARFPAFVGLRFSDDTPVATPETQTWLRAGQASTDGSSSAGSERGDLDEDSRLPEDLAQRLTKSASEGLIEAQRVIEGERSERGRFRMRLQLAVACRNVGLAEVAEAIFGDLERAVDSYGLATWEPTLAGEALSEYLGFLLSREDPMKGESPKLDTLRAKLAHLAPATLARLTGKG